MVPINVLLKGRYLYYFPNGKEQNSENSASPLPSSREKNNNQVTQTPQFFGKGIFPLICKEGDCVPLVWCPLRVPLVWCRL